MPNSTAVRLRHALVNPRVCPVFGQNQQDRSGLLLTALKHCGKTSSVLGETDQRGNFQPRGQPRFLAHSDGGRSAPEAGLSGGVAVDDIGQQAIQHFCIARLKQRRMHPFVAHCPRDGRQCVQMGSACLFGR